MINKLFEISDSCIEEMRENKRMTLTENDEKDFKYARHCYLCKEPFNYNDKRCIKVKDHDHRTGKYRGAAHCKCNINYFSNRYVPIVFHNLKGYDGHHIIRQAYDLYPDKDLSVIPNSYEKFMSFKIGSLKFIDSFQFMSSSLEKLVENLYDNNNDDKYINFPCMKQYFYNHMDLLCRKGFYPYEFIDNNNKLNYNGLPPKENFYDKLKQKHIDDNDYEHAKNVYNKLNCNSFLDYHLTYLKCDVLLLADVFENFRKTCLDYYKLDPANYITAPGLAWDGMLLKTGIKLQLLHDSKLLDIFERMKRGGLCFVGSKRHVKANNKYTRFFKTTGKWINDYNNQHPEKPINIDNDIQPDDNYIIYLDANNLYGWAMSQFLPYDGIEFKNDISIDEVLETPDENPWGYVVECDLIFPKEIHNKLKQFPPAPENLIPNDEWMSDYQLNLKKQLNIKSKCSKLIPHLFEHKNYCIHYRNLKYLVELGVKIGNIHNIVSFYQKPFLKPYIDFNTEMRKNAKNEFEKDFFKLMNNAVFGKTMENVKNRINIHATTSNENAIKWFSKVNLKGCKEFNGLYLIEMLREEIIYDKPLYVGTSILDLSKLCMMEFHYGVIQKNFENNYDLIYSDTDSFVYNIRTPDIYEWIKTNKKYFDLSESKRDDLKDDENKKKLGRYKDELNSLLIDEFLALNPKVYSIKYYNSLENTEIKNKKTLKGISKIVVKNEIEHTHYENVLNTNKKEKRNVCSIRSFNHELFTYTQNKIALSCWYDKMQLINNNECIPYGFMEQ